MPLSKKKRHQSKGADYGYATQMARDFIYKYDIDWLPVDAFEVVSAYAASEKLIIEIKTITDLSFESGVDRHTLIEKVIYGEDGLAIYDPEEDIYTILIDDQAEPFGRVRWTVVHELGHIVLGHLTDSRTSILSWALDEDQYNSYEQESHIFAGEVLAPKFILYRIGAHSSEEIQDICDLSVAASNSRERAIIELINDKRHIHDSMLNTIPSFSQFLEFKTICRDTVKMRIQSRIQQNPPIKKQSAPIETKLFPSGRYEICPACGNIHNATEANYCKLCGELLYDSPPELLPISPCDKLGSKDASFCDYCGHPVYKTRFGLEFEKDEI